MICTLLVFSLNHNQNIKLLCHKNMTHLLVLYMKLMLYMKGASSCFHCLWKYQHEVACDNNQKDDKSILHLPFIFLWKDIKLSYIISTINVSTIKFNGIVVNFDVTVILLVITILARLYGPMKTVVYHYNPI
jgi:hypothetical protein